MARQLSQQGSAHALDRKGERRVFRYGQMSALHHALNKRPLVGTFDLFLQRVDIRLRVA